MSFGIAPFKQAFYVIILSLILVVLMKSFSCLFKKHITYQSCYMSHLLLT